MSANEERFPIEQPERSLGELVGARRHDPRDRAGDLGLDVGAPRRARVALALVAGCASFTKPDNEIRVTEYSGSAEPGLVGTAYVTGDLAVDGCRVIESGSVHVCTVYKGRTCTVQSAGCASDREK